MRKCIKCRATKPLELFRSHGGKRLGCPKIYNVCKKCHAAYEKARRDKLSPEERTILYRKQRPLGRRCARIKRVKIIKKFGSACACCGESQIEFLAVDHINGGGHQHRKQFAHEGAYHKWLLEVAPLSDFRVLCHNCNSSMGHYGYCPHQTPRPFVPPPSCLRPGKKVALGPAKPELFGPDICT